MKVLILYLSVIQNLCTVCMYIHHLHQPTSPSPSHPRPRSFSMLHTYNSSCAAHTYKYKYNNGTARPRSETGRKSKIKSNEIASNHLGTFPSLPFPPSIKARLAWYYRQSTGTTGTDTDTDTGDRSTEPGSGMMGIESCVCVCVCDGVRVLVRDDGNREEGGW